MSVRRDTREWAFDAGVAAALTALSLSIFASISQRGERPAPAVALALLLVHGGCLAWRRRAPLAVMSVNLGTGIVFSALGYPMVMLGVSSVVALYTVASRCERAPALAALGATVTAMAAALLLRESGDLSTVAGNTVVLVVVWFLGDSHRSRRAYVAQLEERTAELERARDELARTAVAEERLRIARELHDVVAHSMGMIAVQAGVGAHVIDSRPEDAKQSLETIEHASKSALGEIRRMLGLLRSREEPAATAPSPGLADLPRLAAETSRSGLRVDLRADRPERPLPPGVELAIYRIVQEAVTNSVRHAAAETAVVSLTFGEGAARVEVVDDGPAAPARPEEGHGIAGMRERVAMHGGTLQAGAAPGGGFRVAASIPLEDGAA
ncbi:MAG TPA: sensor histidine kinase [Actinomycetota bacterium]|nr:sensor histidine kinase [Actinomycetota bacterium]